MAGVFLPRLPALMFVVSVVYVVLSMACRSNVPQRYLYLGLRWSALPDPLFQCCHRVEAIRSFSCSAMQHARHHKQAQPVGGRFCGVQGVLVVVHASMWRNILIGPSVV